ncbi:MAG: mandelate racemase/muconate lactonizing enzyme family protein [Alphaproteobacteria bacterium]|nr:mandelate racemase/muconate lactonizing enzyme family protein [Alphaproteobacteria bacterium]
MTRIENIEIFFIEYPFPKNLNYQYSGGLVENMIVGLIKITDSDGEYGLGEVTHAQFTHKPIIGLVEHFKNILIGLEIGKINNAWEKMYGSSVFWNREGIAIGVMGGINIAMYDLLGKKLELPVYQLIGGLVKEKIKIYASNGLFESSEDLIKDANKAYDMGFRIYKMRIIKPDTIVSLVKDFKKEFANRMELIVDAVQGSTANPWANKVSINLAKELEKYKILFFEEPCRVENIEGYKEIKKSTTLNIAGAESIPTARAFKPYLQSEVFDIVQFDIATSGFTEGRRIADLAYVYNKPLAIHSWGSAISIMAGIHFSLTIPNSAFTEYCFMDHPLNELLFDNSKLEILNGYVEKPKTYGLGVKFDEKILQKYSYREKINTMISTQEADIQLI